MRLGIAYGTEEGGLKVRLEIAHGGEEGGLAYLLPWLEC